MNEQVQGGTLVHSRCWVSISYCSYAVQFMFGRGILGQQKPAQEMKMCACPLVTGKTSFRRAMTSGRGEDNGSHCKLIVEQQHEEASLICLGTPQLLFGTKGWISTPKGGPHFSACSLILEIYQGWVCPRAPKVNHTRVATKIKAVARTGIFLVGRPVLLNARCPTRPWVSQWLGCSPVPPLPNYTAKHYFPSCLCLVVVGASDQL